MDKGTLEKLKQELAKAVTYNDTKKIEEITKKLNIPIEQSKYFKQGLTGYPSVDKVWLNNYHEGAESDANNIPVNKTVFDVVEEKLDDYGDIPALEYFGKVFSRPEFKDMCYVWARTFRALGVEPGEKVPIYGPFVPEIAFMWFGLIMIGACPYFLKLSMSDENLATETREAKIAVVFDGMWENVAKEFTKEKYKNVIIASATTDMPNPTKQIVSFISKIKSLKQKCKIPDDKKYIWVDKALEMADYYTGDVKVPFEPNRVSTITSSSGTTGTTVKGVMATNESMLGQVYSTTKSDIPYEPGFRTLNHFPPTAATSLNSLFLVGLMTGATIVMDPRVSVKDFYNQLTKLNINACINTSSLWDAFFNIVVQEQAKGKNFDSIFDNAKAWMVGGEGPNVKSIKRWDDIIGTVQNPVDGNDKRDKRIYGGYGLSELFSGLCIDRIDSKQNYDKEVPRVGAVQAGMVVGIFDKDGNELSYNQRGELRVKSKAQMVGYYGKPELTENAFEDGWLKTGDIAEIDENGFIYIWGRQKDEIKTSDGRELYLFDVENRIRKNDFIHDVVVLSMPTEDNDNNLVAHIVWDDKVLQEEKREYIERMNKDLKEFLPNGVVVSAYSEHDTMLPYSPTTLKKDKNGMSKQTLGYVQVIDGELKKVEFILNDSGKYTQEYAIIEENRKSGFFRR